MLHGGSAHIQPRELRQLFWRLLKRDMGSRYRGFLIGKLWFVLTPLLMLAVFTFVFSQVFAVRWKSSNDPRQLAIMLFAGLVIFQYFAELLSRAPGLILEERAYVNKSVFPLGVLPMVSVFGALANLGVSFVLLIILHLVMIGPLPLTAMWVPLIISPLVVLSLGLVYLFSAAGVYLRDLKQITPWLAQVCMFLGPVFYPLDSLPEWARPFVLLNPVALIIENTRTAVLAGAAPDFVGLWVYSIAALFVLWCGYSLFSLLKPGFADVA